MEEGRAKVVGFITTIGNSSFDTSRKGLVCLCIGYEKSSPCLKMTIAPNEQGLQQGTFSRCSHRNVLGRLHSRYLILNTPQMPKLNYARAEFSLCLVLVSPCAHFNSLLTSCHVFWRKSCLSQMPNYHLEPVLEALTINQPEEVT